MHSQTGSGTTSTMAYSTIPLPASPTLTNPDMILPYGEYDSTPSPPRGKYNSESAGGDWDDIRRTDMHFSIGPPQVHMGLMTPTTPIIYGNGTMLSDIGEVTEAESTIGRCKLPGPAERRMLKQQQQQQLQQQLSGNHTQLGSSPTVGYARVMKRGRTCNHSRKISIESTSTVRSAGQTAELFKDFDDGVSVDDSVFQGDDEESVADSHSEQVIASETQRLATSEYVAGDEDDRNSSAALSRRAEQILLNAKKRLNNMEGNLTRARSVLYTTPTGSLSSINRSSPLNRSTPSPRNETVVAAPGIPPSKQRQLHTPVKSPPASPRHARVGSENPQRVAPFPIPFPVRSASAAARYVRNDGSKRSPPFAKVNETPRDDSRIMSHSGYAASSLNLSLPPNAILEPLSEDDVSEFDADRASIVSSVDGYLSPSGEHRLTRSTSNMQMRDLKDQMSDLKGRLSVLRDRARDDTMKRRSLQSLRTPSPFTAAEQWYTSSQNYGDPLSADAGVASPPWKGSQNGEVDMQPEQTFHALTTDMPEYAESDVTSVYEDVDEHFPTEAIADRDIRVPEEMGTYKSAEAEQEVEDAENSEEDYNEEIVDREQADDYESDVSLYHDSLSTPISHEDREDAFDYEHFFLHSAMGTISQQRLERRGSFSSEDSAETVQGLSTTVTSASPRGAPGHLRSESTSSISTIATFETATEGSGSDSGNEDEGRESFAVQEVATDLPPHSHTSTPVTAKRFTFGSEVKNFQADDLQSSTTSTKLPSSTVYDQTQRNGAYGHRPSVNSFGSFSSNGTTRSFPLVNKPKVQPQQQHSSSDPNLHCSNKEIEPSLLSDSMTLTDVSNGGERSQTSPVHMLARDDQILVERLVASLGKCVLGLQESGRASYEGRVFRRRLDAARRVLEGDEGPV